MDLRHRRWFTLRNKNARLLVPLIAALQLINDASSQKAVMNTSFQSIIVEEKSAMASVGSVVYGEIFCPTNIMEQR